MEDKLSHGGSAGKGRGLDRERRVDTAEAPAPHIRRAHWHFFWDLYRFCFYHFHISLAGSIIQAVPIKSTALASAQGVLKTQGERENA